MPKTLKKPSFNVLYVLKFPGYFTTWRLERVTEDGYFIFRTSDDNITNKLNLLRWNYMYKKFCVDEINCPEAFKPRIRIKVSLEPYAFRSKEYTKEELDSLIDDIDDIYF